MNPSSNPSTNRSGNPAGGEPGGPDRRDRTGPTTSEEWEQLRRSVAMLSPGAWALKREPALLALNLLLDHLRAARAQTGHP